MKNTVLMQISRFIDYLDKLSPKDIIGLESGAYEISFVLKGKNNKQTPFENKYVIDVKSIITYLESLNNREEGMQYLTSLDLKNDTLGMLVKALDLPYNKKDSKSKMVDKIIEGTIGYRLRSSAIQNGI